MKTVTTTLMINSRPATRAEVKRISGTTAQVAAEPVDEEYEAWKREQGLSQPLSCEAYNVEFST